MKRPIKVRISGSWRRYFADKRRWLLCRYMLRRYNLDWWAWVGSEYARYYDTPETSALGLMGESHYKDFRKWVGSEQIKRKMGL